MHRLNTATLNSADTIPRWKRVSAGFLVAWLLLSPTGLVFAGPVADATIPASQPGVTTAATGSRWSTSQPPTPQDSLTTATSA